MKPAARRRVERQIQRIMEQDGDRCSVCKIAFPNSSRTFGGTTAGGEAALVGECCHHRLKDVLLAGVYGDSRYRDIAFGAPGQKPAPRTEAEISQAIGNLQQTFRGIDQAGARLMTRAGLAGREPRLNTADSAWKDDDARWFKANLTRSHRIRAPFPGELDSLPKEMVFQLPAGHDFQMLVRQIEPGKRVRLPFGRNMNVPIPDTEPLIHALFDVVGSSQGGAVSAATVAELAMKYANAGKDPKQEN